MPTYIEEMEADDDLGVQLCGSRPHQLIPAAEAVLGSCPDVDFIDINCGCPIDLVVSPTFHLDSFSQLTTGYSSTREPDQHF